MSMIKMTDLSVFAAGYRLLIVSLLMEYTNSSSTFLSIFDFDTAHDRFENVDRVEVNVRFHAFIVLAHYI